MKLKSLLLFSTLFALTPCRVSRAQSAPATASSAANTRPAPAEFTVAGMDCPKCSAAAQAALAKLPGVETVAVDLAGGGARLTTRAPVSRAAVARALGPLGFAAQFPDEPEPPPLSEAERAALDMRVLSHGEPYDLKKGLAPGKITIVDFYAEWCGSCRVLGPRLERLLLGNPRLALRKIELPTWESESARQATREFGLAGLPYVRVYGPDGKLLGAVAGNQSDELQKLIRKGLSS
jgi:copper chaperone CopZ